MEKLDNLDPAIKPSITTDLAENFKSEIALHTHAQLQNIKKKLSYLAINVDPYDLHQEQKAEVTALISEFKLQEHVENPFEFTNKLLQLLDLTEEQIKLNQH